MAAEFFNNDLRIPVGKADAFSKDIEISYANYFTTDQETIQDS